MGLMDVGGRPCWLFCNWLLRTLKLKGRRPNEKEGRGPKGGNIGGHDVFAKKEKNENGELPFEAQIKVMLVLDDLFTFVVVG